MYDLKVVVEEIKGFCDLPMETGDYFEVKGGKLMLPEGKHICIWALQSLMSFIPAKQRKVDEENDWIPHTKRLTCPDPEGRVIFRIDRMDPVTGKKIDETEERPPRILVDEEKCTGCRTCETICSFEHSGSFTPVNSRIKVKKIEEEGKDIPNICRQCGDAPCVKACPVDALKRDRETKAIIVDQKKCIGCKQCAEACPFDAINFIEIKDTPLICDLCGGQVECVTKCPTQALKYDKGGEN
ncbi:MAG: TIGR04076 family protein [Halanaerobiales bacterium]